MKLKIDGEQVKGFIYSGYDLGYRFTWSKDCTSEEVIELLRFTIPGRENKPPIIELECEGLVQGGYIKHSSCSPVNVDSGLSTMYVEIVIALAAERYDFILAKVDDDEI